MRASWLARLLAPKQEKVSGMGPLIVSLPRYDKSEELSVSGGVIEAVRVPNRVRLPYWICYDSEPDDPAPDDTKPGR